MSEKPNREFFCYNRIYDRNLLSFQKRKPRDYKRNYGGVSQAKENGYIYKENKLNNINMQNYHLLKETLSFQKPMSTKTS